jgi:glycolate oxidase iron-sulfur subunit
MAHAVDTCVHCGFCLPDCPTYQVLQEEMDSPRGRIFLMKEVLEGNVELEDALPYIDRCLGCLACEPACPSGVPYRDLITPFRALADDKRKRTVRDRVIRALLLSTLPYPVRFRLSAKLARLGLPFRGFMPGGMKAMLDLLPSTIPKRVALPAHIEAEGQRRARVALLAGCAQQVLAPDINLATIRVLAKNGVEVHVPKSQGCCGSLAAHTGAARQACRHAERNLAAFPDDVDAIVTNAAGCGSGMQEYALWLAGTPQEESAKRFSAKVCDVSRFLDQLGPRQPDHIDPPLRVAYHDACHLAQGQKVKAEPRALLKSIEGLDLVEIRDPDTCCGSAGTYNIEQPEIAAQLGERKAKAIQATGAAAVVTGNIGCMTQIENHLAKIGHPIPVLHTVQILDRANAE